MILLRRPLILCHLMRSSRGGMSRRCAHSTAVLALLVLTSCATASVDQQLWMAKRDQQPLTFVVPADEADFAWSRAQEWIVKFGEQPIATATDTLLQTAVGQRDFDATVSLTVTRAKQPDGSYRFDVVARSANPLVSTRLVNTARALAYYTASGIPYPAR